MDNNNNGDNMTKKITIISVLIISTLLVSLYVISSTYSVIINVIGRDDGSEVIEKITIRDIIMDDNGDYNDLYYDVKRELDISYEEGEVLINSVLLNNVLETILNDVVGYKLHHKTRLTNSEIYDLIVSNVRNDNTINDSVKDKVINKTGVYLDDIVDYIYDFDIVKNGVLA